MSNRLADAPSPYLRQHADNPVEWWPWCDEAFEEAKRRDVPVFLSIGYATCHWCHVMAHGSFEDDEVAALLNDGFVAIKVDREERPDIDAAYMAACQAAGQRGGWPLTVVLDHDRRPWFIGTYFAKQSNGRIGMMDLLPRLTQAWQDRRDEVQKSAVHLLDHIASHPETQDKDAIIVDLVMQAVADLKQRFDPQNGGFGPTPKFPSPHQIMLILRHHRRTDDPDALHMVRTTLDAMASGGIHDHVGGGFHRYSTDAEWHLPHFEKMLYDQAMLMMAYTEAFQVTGNPEYASVVGGIAQYVLRDLRHPDGGFFCAEDADSEGEEGTFYVWTADELRHVLGAGAGPFMDAYGCREEGNFHDEATGKPVPANILHRRSDIDPLEHETALARLFHVRARRERPLRDDKVLTDWNGLMIAALAKAGAALGQDDLVEAAGQAARFIFDHLRTEDGRLVHRWHDGRIDEIGFLDDQAFLAWGVLELFAATGETDWLRHAEDVAASVLDRFNQNGALRLTATDGERMVIDSTTAYDGAIPSGTSVAITVLERLGRLTGESRWTDAAWDAVRHVDGFASHPSAFNALLCGLPALLGHGQEVVVTGDGDAANAMHQEVLVGFHPDAVVIRHTGQADLPEWVQAHDAARDAAYVCRDRACDAPVHDVDALRTALQV